MTGRADFARVARETLDYLLREMTAPDGGFYSATDADSEGPTASPRKGVLRLVRGGDPAACWAPAPRPSASSRYYGVTAGGNFEGAQHPARRRAPTRASAPRWPARARRSTRRAPRRPPPLRDEKILAAWNGLAISALRGRAAACSTSRATSTPPRARRRFVLDKHAPGRPARAQLQGRPRRRRRLPRRLRVRRAPGCFDLYEATFEPRWLREALALADETERLFADPAGGWFMTAADHEKLIAREKPAYDGAEPSGTSVALLNALRARDVHRRRSLARDRRPRASPAIARDADRATRSR